MDIYRDIDRSIIMEQAETLARSGTTEARRFFAKLDPSLDPRLSTVVVPTSTPSADISVFGSDDFQVQDATALRTIVADWSEDYFKPLVPDIRTLLWDLRVNSCKALQACIDAELADSDKFAFVSIPWFARDLCVFGVLEFQRSQINSIHAINGSRWGYPIGTSLVSESIRGFMGEIGSSLEILSEGHGGYLSIPDHGDQFWSAGFWLMQHVEESTNRRIKSENSDNPYRHLVSLAAEYYEKREARATVLFVPKRHEAIDLIVEFKRPIHIGHYRSVRKLLELSSPAMILLADPSRIYGLGALKEGMKKTYDDIFQVDFLGHALWSLSHFDTQLMLVEHGRPRIPRNRLLKQEFLSAARRIFDEIDDQCLDGLWEVVIALSSEGHGTTLAISEGAEKEARRLRAQATPVKPFLLTPLLVKPLSRIDGAILAKPDGTCFAVGAILDGVATKAGDPARGSRFNSAVRYKQYSNRRAITCMLIVFSDDGSVDYL